MNIFEFLLAAFLLIVLLAVIILLSRGPLGSWAWIIGVFIIYILFIRK